MQAQGCSASPRMLQVRALAMLRAWPNTPCGPCEPRPQPNRHGHPQYKHLLCAWTTAPVALVSWHRLGSAWGINNRRQCPTPSASHAGVMLNMQLHILWLAEFQGSASDEFAHDFEPLSAVCSLHDSAVCHVSLLQSPIFTSRVDVWHASHEQYGQPHTNTSFMHRCTEMDLVGLAAQVDQSGNM